MHSNQFGTACHAPSDPYSLPSSSDTRQRLQGGLGTHVPQAGERGRKGRVLAQDALPRLRVRLVARRGLGRALHEVRGGCFTHLGGEQASSMAAFCPVNEWPSACWSKNGHDGQLVVLSSPCPIIICLHVAHDQGAAGTARLMATMMTQCLCHVSRTSLKPLCVSSIRAEYLNGLNPNAWHFKQNPGSFHLHLATKCAMQNLVLSTAPYHTIPKNVQVTEQDLERVVF